MTKMKVQFSLKSKKKSVTLSIHTNRKIIVLFYVVLNLIVLIYKII